MKVIFGLQLGIFNCFNLSFYLVCCCCCCLLNGSISPWILLTTIRFYKIFKVTWTFDFSSWLSCQTSSGLVGIGVLLNCILIGCDLISGDFTGWRDFLDLSFRFWSLDGVWELGFFMLLSWCLGASFFPKWTLLRLHVVVEVSTRYDHM